MADKPKSVRLSCTTTPQVSEAVEQLLWSGLWGSTRAEVVERLVSHAIRDVLHPDGINVIAQEVRDE